MGDQFYSLALLDLFEVAPVAEEAGLIVPIGEWVFKTVCAQAKAWQDDGLPALTMGVNLSVRQFMQAKLTDRIAQILKETGLEPRYLELELTEPGLYFTFAPEQAVHFAEVIDAQRPAPSATGNAPARTARSRVGHRAAGSRRPGPSWTPSQERLASIYTSDYSGPRYGASSLPDYDVFREQTRHLRFDEGGGTNTIVDERRRSTCSTSTRGKYCLTIATRSWMDRDRP